MELQTRVLALVAACGLMLGTQIGISGPALVFIRDIQNCTMFTGADSCNHYSSHCVWKKQDAAVNCTYCLFADGVDCGLFFNESTCTSSSSSSCFWRNDQCFHHAGWSALEIGLFGSLLCAGALAMTPFIECATKRVAGGRPQMLFGTGIFALAVAVAAHIAFWKDVLPAILVTRAIVGASTSVSCVTCNLFVGEYVRKSRRRLGGALFQGATTVGIVLITLVALVLRETVDWATTTDLMSRLQGVLAMNTLSATAMTLLAGEVLRSGAMPLGVFEEDQDDDDAESSPILNRAAHGSSSSLDDDPTTAAKTTEQEAVCSHPSEWACTVALPLAQQSGINTVISFGVLVAASIGMNPLLGSLLITIWNCLTSVAAVFLASRMSFRNAFLIGLACCVASNLISSIGMWPGVCSTETARNVVVFVGCLAFVAAFELAVAPTYYPIASRTMSNLALRDKSMAFTLFLEGVFSFATTFGYPLFLDLFSSSQRGQSMSFLVFVGTGGLTLIILSLFLKPSVDYK